MRTNVTLTYIAMVELKVIEDLHGLELSPTKRLAAAAMAARCAAILYPVAAAIENPEASGHPCRFFSRFLHLALLF